TAGSAWTPRSITTPPATIRPHAAAITRADIVRRFFIVDPRRRDGGGATIDECDPGTSNVRKLARRRSDFVGCSASRSSCSLLRGRRFDPEGLAADGKDQLMLRGPGQRTAARLDSDRLRPERAVKPARDLVHQQVVLREA